MTSYEHYRTKAYADDIRWRIVWQVLGLQYTHKKVAENLGIQFVELYLYSKPLALFPSKPYSSGEGI